MARYLDLPGAAEAALIAGARDGSPVKGLTHGYYKYPARSVLASRALQLKRSLSRATFVSILTLAEEPHSLKRSPPGAKPWEWTLARLPNSSRASSPPFFPMPSWMYSNAGRAASLSQ